MRISDWSSDVCSSDLTMKAHGAYSVLVSGGFMPFAGPVAEAIGFDQVVANELEIRDGKLTGRVIDPVVDSAAKLETLQAEAAKHGLPPAETLAGGDRPDDGRVGEERVSQCATRWAPYQKTK